jgi:hypothetical protein
LATPDAQSAAGDALPVEDKTQMPRAARQSAPIAQSPSLPQGAPTGDRWHTGGVPLVSSLAHWLLAFS